MEDQTEEGGDLTSQEEVVEVEVEVGKEELVAGMTVTISALILDPHVPAGIDLSHLFAVFQYPCPTLSLCFFFGSVSRPGKGQSGSSAGGRNGGRGRGEGGDQERDGRHNWKSKGKALPRSLVISRTSQKSGEGIRLEGSSMPLQKIFMTNENQEQLKELLRDLQTQDFDEPYEYVKCTNHSFCFTTPHPHDHCPLSESDSDFSRGEEEEFDELDHREEGQFWITNDEPVECADSPAYEPYESADDDERSIPGPVISLFAIGKLCRLFKIVAFITYVGVDKFNYSYQKSVFLLLCH